VLETRGPIQAPAAVAWRLLTDTHEWPHWGPSVRAVDCPTRLIDADTRGRVQTALGLWLPFQITDWEPEQFWSWVVAGVPATGHRVMATGPDTCEITFTIPTWAPFYLPVCKTAIRHLEQLAAGQFASNR
jgi:hypothetical protein